MWDLQIDLRTGDLVFNANRDLAGAVAENIIAQRIHTRLIVPLGSFMFNVSLGSRLKGMTRSATAKNSSQIEEVIREALSTMGDIEILDVVVEPSPTDSRALLAHITYQISDFVNENTGDQQTVTVNVDASGSEQ